MGRYDTVTFDDGVAVTFPGLDADPSEVSWQTKTVEYPPSFSEYQVTRERRLLKKELEWESVPEEERPGYDADIGGFENPDMEWFGALTARCLGWRDTEYHGTVEVHASVAGAYVSFDLTFTDGELVAVTRRE